MFLQIVAAIVIVVVIVAEVVVIVIVVVQTGGEDWHPADRRGDDANGIANGWGDGSRGGSCRGHACIIIGAAAGDDRRGDGHASQASVIFQQTRR